MYQFGQRQYTKHAIINLYTNIPKNISKKKINNSYKTTTAAIAMYFIGDILRYLLITLKYEICNIFIVLTNNITH